MQVSRVLAFMVCVAAIVGLKDIGPGSPTSGFLLDLAATVQCYGDNSQVVATVHGNHQAQLNVNPAFDVADARKVIRDRLRTRAEKSIYLRANSDVAFEDVVEFLDAVRPEAEVISLITPHVEQQRALRGGCLALSERIPRGVWRSPAR
jgi:hypothetical protein